MHKTDRFTRTTEERFDKKTIKINDCVVWIGCRDRRGYGRFNIGNQITIAAHRASWILKNGPIKQGLYVLHKCDNPPCVRLEHLFIGTQRENIQDMMNKRRAKTGEQTSWSKLTTKQVLEIRRRYVPSRKFIFSKNSSISLGKEFGVCHSHVLDIVKHKKWKHV